jgi:predicted NodU family carbamoyl transferase
MDTSGPFVRYQPDSSGGEPIVCTPDDAIKCFLGTDIDFLAIGPFLVSKV